MTHQIYRPRIVLADNDARALNSLTEFITQQLPNICIAETYLNGPEVIESCRKWAERYDLLLVDLSMEGMQGTEICHKIRRINGKLPILGMTSFSLNRYRETLIEAGAQGIVDKSNSSMLIQAIVFVLSGHHMDGFESPAISHTRIKKHPSAISPLTNTQERIMELCANEYMSDPEIADRLQIAPATVRKHLQNITKRLHCKTQRQAIAIWIHTHHE